MFRFLNGLFFAFVFYPHLVVAQSKQDTSKPVKLQLEIKNFYSLTKNNVFKSENTNAIASFAKLDITASKSLRFTVGAALVKKIFGSETITEWYPGTTINNRYELGVFDMARKSDNKWFARLEEMNMQWKFKKSIHVFGRQWVNSPFNNLQLARMRPTSFQGYWASYQNEKNTLRWGIFNAVSPSSTFQWYSLGASLGIYPMGVLANGNKADYSRKITSKGLLLLAYEKKSKNIELEFWNQYVENIFNSTFLQVTIKARSNPAWELGGFSIVQHKLNDGGNADPNFTYYTNKNSSLIFSTKIQYKSGSNSWSANFTRITKKGKYLMPREWGREPFFTFSIGERNEGAGDMTALSVKQIKSFSKKGMQIISSLGYYQMPDVKNYYLNKYGLPSYLQCNINLKWQGTRKWAGFSADLLALYKLDLGETYNIFRYEINKVNVFHFAFITKYTF